jgi:transcriptional regulator with PAS, ATPase and Fis domain
LTEKIVRGEFREDLYYRLRVVEIALPPLRDRREDIPRLARHFLERFAAREGREVPTIERDAFAALLAHDFAGNVRELENLLEGAASLAVAGSSVGRTSSGSPRGSLRSSRLLRGRRRPRCRTCAPWKSVTSDLS